MPNPQTPRFPTAIAEDTDLLVVKNRSISQLKTDLDAVSTQFSVVDGTKFETPCLVQIDTEIIKVQSKTGDQLQYCTRAFNGTAAAFHTQNANVNGYILAYHHNQLAAEITAIQTALGANLSNLLTSSTTIGGDFINSFSDLRLAPNGVSAGVYGGDGQFVSVTIDATGRVTNVATVDQNSVNTLTSYQNIFTPDITLGKIQQILPTVPCTVQGPLVSGKAFTIEIVQPSPAVVVTFSTTAYESPTSMSAGCLNSNSRTTMTLRWSGVKYILISLNSIPIA